MNSEQFLGANEAKPKGSQQALAAAGIGFAWRTRGSFTYHLFHGLLPKGFDPRASDQ